MNSKPYPCERFMLCEDTFDSMEQVMPIFASVIDITGMTPAMAAVKIVNELKNLREQVKKS